MMKKNDGPLAYLIKLKDLELRTESGKVNYKWGMLLVFLVVVLTSTNWILKGLAFVIGAIKTAILQENITESYEEANTIVLIILTFAFFIICFLILFLFEKYKEKLDKELKKSDEQSEK